MTGTLLLAIMIGPASYKMGANFPVYREDLSPNHVPFPIAETAQQVTYLLENDGLIHATWRQNPADLQQWLNSMESRGDAIDLIFRSEYP